LTRSRLVALAALAALTLVGGLVGPIPTTSAAPAVSVATTGPRVFSNTTAITIHDKGAATPYPSTIQVTGLTTEILDVDVTLKRYSHTCPWDVAVLLVAPTGERSLLMADLGSGLGCPEAVNADVTFDDAATDPVPYPPTTGTWAPLDGEPTEDDVFPAPAPAGGSHPTSLGVFNGLIGNGTWSLYVLDENGGDAGSISGGWSLSITSVPDTTAPDTIITKAPRKKSTKRKARIKFVSTEPGSTFRCSLDGAKPKPCTSPVKYKRLEVGKHKFKVYAVDAAGNADPTPDKVKFKVKRKKPAR